MNINRKFTYSTDKKILHIPSLSEVDFHVNKCGEGFVKFRLDRVEELGELLNNKPAELRILTVVKAKAKKVKYYLGAVNGTIELARDQVGSNIMRYGSCNVWAKIDFIVQEEA